VKVTLAELMDDRKFRRGLRNGILLSVPIWVGIVWVLIHYL
jgi:hypothetical protein